MVIDLPKTGFAVHFKEWLPQRAYEKYLTALSNGLNPREVSQGNILNDRIDYAAADLAVRATLEYLIEKIVTKDNKEIRYSSKWADDLPKSDFSLIALEVTRLKDEEDKAQEEGKKNSGGTGAGAGDEGGKSAS
jgi:hypothetical protein